MNKPKFALMKRVAIAPVQRSSWAILSPSSNPSWTTMRTKITRTKILTTTNKVPAAKANGRSARRRSREFALQGIYSWLLRGADGLQEATSIDAHIRGDEEFGEADAAWFKTLLFGVMREAPVLRERFLPYVDRPLEELSPIEHGILLIGS